MVLAESCQVIDNDLASVIRFDDHGWRVAATCGREVPADFDGLVSHVTSTFQDAKHPVIIERVPGTAASYETLLWAPMVAKENRLGGILLARGAEQGPFTPREEILIAALARQAAVALDNARLHQAELVRQRMEQELQLGRKMQSSLIPDSVPILAGWEFAAWWQPAREVSGDYYDFIPLAEQLGVVIADVADKGVQAALFMAMTRSIVRASVTALREPRESLRRANHLITADATDGMFVTLFYAQFDTGGNVTYVNAGHNPPLWYQADAAAFSQLSPTSILLGVEYEVPLEERTITVSPGDFLVLYTDGITEAENPAGEMFGEERLAMVVGAHRNGSAQEILDRILAAVNVFIAATPQSDDVTLVIAKRV
jgi:sigma-B regulation protein RsbU (phosphoserine phosphatase)